MPHKFKVKSILKNARDIQTVWRANPDYKMADIASQDFLSICQEANELVEEQDRDPI